jgi:DNA invertase Pin-like site-specific DNA recombinase
MPYIYAYCRVSHEDSSESGLGVEAGLHSVVTWWKYQQDAGRFLDYTWGPKGWRGERVEPKLKGELRSRSSISKYDRGQDTNDGIFVDEAVSAYKVRLLRRPAGGRLGDILRRDDMVVFPRLDRAFRGVADFAVTIERWQRAGNLVHFVNPQVDMTTAYGRAFAAIAATFAELESSLKSERLKEAQAQGRERGQKMGRHASFGWKQEGWTTRIVSGELKQVPRMVPNEQEREEVRLIVQWRDIEGISFAAIADRLEEMHAASEHREPWPRAPFAGSQHRRWDQNRVYKAYKARKRVPMPSSTVRLAFDYKTVVHHPVCT